MRLCSALLMGLLAGLATVVGQARIPSIAFDSVSKDIGKVVQGETIKQIFTFTNKGTGTLEIKSLEPS